MIKKLLFGIVALFLVLSGIYYIFPGTVIKSANFLELSAAGLHKSSVIVDNHTIYYVEGGEGESILFVHGYGQNKENWVRMAKYLTPNYHVVCVDLPGAGESSKLDSYKYSIKGQTLVLDKFCEKINLEKFHIVGNSMGGAIASYYLRHAPDKLLSVSLFNSGSVPGAQKSDLAKLAESGKNPFSIETEEDFDELLKYVFVKEPPIPGPVKEFFVEQAKENREFNEKIKKDIEEENYQINLKEIGKTDKNILVLWGDKDRLCHVSGAYILNKAIPGSELVILKDCGHVPMIERPKETADHYMKFLEGIEI